MKSLYILLIIPYFTCINIYAQELSVFFPLGSSYISKEDQEKIKAVVRQHPNASWQLTGHSSSSSSEENNFRLSEQRIEVVAKILTENNIPPSSIAQFPKGESDADQHIDNPKDRFVQIRYLTSRPPLSKSLPEKTGTIWVNVYDSLSKKEITGYYTLNDVLYSFSGSFSVPIQSKLFIQAKSYPDTLVHVISSDINVALIADSVHKIYSSASIYFYGNSAEIIPESFRELETFYNEIKSEKDIVIEIRGHVNQPYQYPVNAQQKDKLQQLSEERALAVKKWLQKRGINMPMRHVGLGNTQMRFPYATSEGQETQNRRVEIILIKTSNK